MGLWKALTACPERTDDTEARSDRPRGLHSVFAGGVYRFATSCIYSANSEGDETNVKHLHFTETTILVRPSEASATVILDVARAPRPLRRCLRARRRLKPGALLANRHAEVKVER